MFSLLLHPHPQYGKADPSLHMVFVQATLTGLGLQTTLKSFNVPVLPAALFFDEGIYFFRVYVFCIFVFSLCCSSNRDCDGFGRYRCDILINVNLFFMGRYDVLWKQIRKQVKQILWEF